MQQQRRRSRLIIGLMALGLLTGLALTASPTQAVDAVGPYYAEPAWDQKKAAANRFVVLTNWNSEAVLDKETGLVWERSPAGGNRLTWDQARLDCLTRTTGNRTGWRLPSLHELASLVDPSVAAPGPTLPPGHPFTTAGPDFYWSATTSADNSIGAWSVNFLTGNVNSISKSNNDQVWCVRGGMNADAY